MGKGFDKFKKWVDNSTEKLNKAASNLNNKVKNEVKHYQKNGDIQKSFEKASYLYEIIGTTGWNDKPKRIRGFLVEDDLKILFKLDDENQSLVVKNVLLQDVNDESIIQIDEVFRDEAVYLDLKVNDSVVPIGCLYATYKAKDIPSDPKNIIKVEEDQVVGQVHFKTKS